MPRDVVRVSGPDAPTYLQAQLSQDLSAVRVGTIDVVVPPATNRQGDALVRVTVVGDDEVLLDVDGGSGPTSSRRLDALPLRVKADIEAARLAGDRRAGRRSRAVDAGGRRRGPRPGGGRSAATTCSAPTRRHRPGCRRCDAAALEVARIEAGWPAMGAEITDQTIPRRARRGRDRSRQLHEGLLPGPGAGRAHGLAAARRRPASCGGWRRRDGSTLASSAAVMIDGHDVGRVTSAFGGAAPALVGRAVDVGAHVTVDGVAATVLDLR